MEAQPITRQQNETMEEIYKIKKLAVTIRKEKQLK